MWDESAAPPADSSKISPADCAYTSGAPNSAATLSNISAGIGTGIMSRARWALTNELPKIEAMLTGFTG